MDSLAHIFKALSEPLRLRIVYLLLQRDSLCVCDLVSVLEQGQSTISRHLAYLKHAGLVSAWREGNWMHYRLEKSALSQIHLQPFTDYLHRTPECKQDLARLIDYEKSPRSCPR
ncbi:metalloregulator ArsR/SmtB family transcription factor [Thiomicrorhabdus sp. zzn3]|uniref:ArsR/SmtB family transcription factor n=1 Tax=Thiomicrorhabdus sp. zzn3 TaxID=3039775 RepID=UPI0024368643|nr:metalloregulator ArsR/SmtB family transcription factor [Thiomicrorhabdus sp. zzn3]MDG6777152.1 metalloregulator ArsR/SmtB family transcription factor [Thiomicrorhabdus sp. zzn3]